MTDTTTHTLSTQFPPGTRVLLTDASLNHGSLPDIQEGMQGTVHGTESEFVFVVFDGEGKTRGFLPYRLSIIADQEVQPWEEVLATNMYLNGAVDALDHLTVHLAEMQAIVTVAKNTKPESLPEDEKISYTAYLEALGDVFASVEHVRDSISVSLNG